MAKRIAATGPAEEPWDLPNAWRWVQLGDVAELIRGVTYAKPQIRSENDHRAIALLRGNNIQAGSLDFNDLTYVDEACVKPDQFIRASDIVLTMSSGSIGLIGKSGWAARDLGRTTFGAFCGVIRSSSISARLLYYFLQTDHYRRLIRDLAKGTNINNLKRDHLIEMAMPVPPADTQVSIVARIDELFAEIDDGEAALARARDDLETWRKALLKAAVTGELTADWRFSHPPAETGAELMARILADRRTRWGMDPRNARKKYAEPNGIDIDPSETVPAGWAIASIEQVAFVENGQTPKGIDAAVGVTGDIPWFKVSSMNAPGNVDLLTESKWWLSAVSAARLGLRLHPAGSIVFPKRGGSIYTEKKRRLGRPGSIDLNVMAVVPLDGAAGHLWTFFRNLSLRAISDGSNVPQINYDDVAQLRIMLPPSEEAQEISARVEGALAITSEVEGDIDQLLFDAKVLRQSILAAAFRGDLA